MTPIPARKRRGKAAKSRLFFCLAALLVFLSSGCSFPSDLPFFGPTATYTPTETMTPSLTPTATDTSTPMLSPTATETNTPLPPRFETQAQQNGSTLVLDRVCGYQFILPAGWKMDIGETNTVLASIPRVTDMLFDPNLTMMLTIQPRKYETLELELYGYTDEQMEPLDSVLSQAITTNGYGTALGTLKLKKNVPGMLHPTFTQTYAILFLCEDEVIVLKFSEWFDKKGHAFSTTELQSIYSIQNSIQFK